MERVLWPMEPVEPRMASFFTQLFSQIHFVTRIPLRVVLPMVAAEGYFRRLRVVAGSLSRKVTGLRQ